MSLVQALPFSVLDDKLETVVGSAALCTMHLAKGLEFRAVAVMACDDEIIPLRRHLLYLACTRARDRLLVTSVEPSSEFLEDLMGTN